MNIIRIIRQRDNNVLDLYLKDNIREHVSRDHILELLDYYPNILRNILDRLIMDMDTKVLLWRRKIITKWNRRDIPHLHDHVNVDEMSEILTGHNNIKYDMVSYNNSNNNNTIRKSCNLLHYNTEYTRTIIEIPLCHTVKEYKIMIDNWNRYSNRFEFINTNDEYNAKYIHYILFNLILGKMSTIPNWIIFHDYNINIPILDYLLHEYPSFIDELYRFGTKKSETIRNICIRYFTAYLNRSIVNDYWKKYYRMHIDYTTSIELSDIKILTC